MIMSMCSAARSLTLVAFPSDPVFAIDFRVPPGIPNLCILFPVVCAVTSRPKSIDELRLSQVRILRRAKAISSRRPRIVAGRRGPSARSDRYARGPAESYTVLTGKDERVDGLMLE
jgi:hypothetical protein